MTILAKTVLHATPQQQQQLAAIWDKPPRSIDELIQYQQRTDQVLTPDQRAKLLPIRKKVQNSIVDKMLEPARGGFGADDFEKFKKEVKARVDHRIDGQ
jgi:hypothetical protein